MNVHEAIKILRNTAWLGSNEDRDKTEQAIEVVAEAVEQSCDNDCEHCEWVTCPKMEPEPSEDCISMTNAEKFQKVFGYYATEMWAKPEKEFLEWINAEALDQNCVKCKHYFETEDDTGVHSQCRLESDEDGSD